MISVIIPTLNEEKALPATLAALNSQAGDFEVIVVDGGSSDSTQKIVQSTAHTRWLIAPRGRATQMNAGARVAQGELLLFLHADTLLPGHGITRLAGLDEQVLAGCFKQRFSQANRRLRMISWLHNQRCGISKVMYGDQAMFVRRELFLRLGGFPEVLMEDIFFSRRLLNYTEPLRLTETVVTDSRKFAKMGIGKSFWRIVLILLCLRAGLQPPKTFFADIR